MRFLRHLAAVLLVVAAVVLLALGWNHIADPANLPSLRHTVVIEAGAAAAVVIIDVIRRRWRRARRTSS